mmetsp:Transcript_29457/g.35869  ORF Transcript_29457/g.35869 Transcript_29457/m.35869 type:complete len:254 (+) Transcript_29457:89-850(+)|eukprot:CAMPEP_0194382690 /NCGR_PEP_ID=MMETSP0174-20130528/62239_1 /TAXON_ID=216777 /ORGANISM="Proboscia alata, Strain PI-D3" /LENGTH=253 /DNA_ID=CAMNT_0039168199 /DNA_START=73 /DNA_END=834 /DNA_ORIENTATION=-
MKVLSSTIAVLSLLIDNSHGFSAPRTDYPAGKSAAEADQERNQRRMKIAEEYIQNDGFHRPFKNVDVLSDKDFVYTGPVVGPLNKQDYIGTVTTFKVYDAFPAMKVTNSPLTRDPEDPNRYWSVIRVNGGAHTGELNMGSTKVPPTGNIMTVGPQSVSATLDEKEDKIVRYTAGYIIDNRDGDTGDYGAMFAVLKTVGAFTPRPGGKTARFLNMVGSMMKDFPKGRSHVDDLPEKWSAMGRKYGLRSKDAWSL